MFSSTTIWPAGTKFRFSWYRLVLFAVSLGLEMGLFSARFIKYLTPTGMTITEMRNKSKYSLIKIAFNVYQGKGSLSPVKPWLDGIWALTFQMVDGFLWVWSKIVANMYVSMWLLRSEIKFESKFLTRLSKCLFSPTLTACWQIKFPASDDFISNTHIRIFSFFWPRQQNWALSLCKHFLVIRGLLSVI